MTDTTPILDRNVVDRAWRFLPRRLTATAKNLTVVPHWVGSDGFFWYRRQTAAGAEFVVVDPATGARRPAFDHQRLAVAMAEVLDIEVSPDNLPFQQFSFGPDLRSITFQIEDALWTFDLETYETFERRSLPAPSIDRSMVPSPDGTRQAFVRDFDIWVRDTDSGDERRLTEGGEEYYSFGLGFTANGRQPSMLWSGDGRRLVALRCDERGLPPTHMVDYGDGDPQTMVHTSIPGDVLGAEAKPREEIILFDLEHGRMIELDCGPLPGGQTFLFNRIDLDRLWWRGDDRAIRFLSFEPGEQTVRLSEADADTGATRILIEESNDTFLSIGPSIYHGNSVRDVPGTHDVVWFSERDGWAHLYLYDGRTGDLKNRITEGEIPVTAVLRVDADHVYFMARGLAANDPYLQKLCRAPLAGGGLEVLTPEDAEHWIQSPGPGILGFDATFRADNGFFSPDGRFFVDVMGSIDTAPASVLRTTDGKRVAVLEEADLGDFMDGAVWPEMFSVHLPDEDVDIYGTMFFPPGFDPSASYPVINFIYAGPQVAFATKSLKGMGAVMGCQAMVIAAHGFIVVQMDGRGTIGRSKEWHDAFYGRHSQGGGIGDHVAALRELAASRPYMDLDRTGIIGASCGGQYSVESVLQHPDFYRVCVSMVPAYGVAMSEAWFLRYQGEDTEENRRELNLIPRLGKIRAKLMIVYGGQDHGCGPPAVMPAVRALEEAGKSFDLVALTGVGHAAGLTVYAARRYTEFFVRHLQGREMPDGIETPPNLELIADGI